MNRRNKRKRLPAAPRSGSAVGGRSLKRGSAEAGGDLMDLRRRVLAAERRPRYQIFAYRQPADRNRLVADLANEGRGDRDRLRVVAGDRDADRSARAMRVGRQLLVADRIEG